MSEDLLNDPFGHSFAGSPRPARVAEGFEPVAAFEFCAANHVFKPLREAVRLDGLPLPVGEDRPCKVLPFFVTSAENVERRPSNRHDAFGPGLRSEAVSVADVDLALVEVNVFPPEADQFPASKARCYGNLHGVPKPLEIRAPAHGVLLVCSVPIDVFKEPVQLIGREGGRNGFVLLGLFYVRERVVSFVEVPAFSVQLRNALTCRYRLRRVLCDTEASWM